MRRIFTRIWVLIVLLNSVVAWASQPVSGTFTATQVCEAYVSKNKRTNPDHTRLVVANKYEIFETNKANNPTWYRVKIQSASPRERWVAKSCGTIVIGGTSPDTPDVPADDCHTPGLADSYVLALSWQPAFCDTHRDKPECKIDDKKSYQARNFTLHGLWPNKKSCGTGYGYCGEVRSRPGGFCDYPALSLYTETRIELGTVMPSAAEGSCLQRHEWFKHGTCQTNWSMDEYYEVAIDLTRQFNESGIAYFISRNIGKTVTEQALIDKVDCAHGQGAHKRLELKCKSGNLVDVYVHLPESIDEGDALGELMRQAEGKYKSNCGGDFRIDPIGFAR